MNDVELALVLLGAFWAGTSSVFSGMKLVGDLRDRIILGKLEGQDLPVPYLRRLLLIQWLPLKVALAVISLVLGVIIVALPDLRDSVPSPDHFRTICNWAAVMPFTGAGFQLITAAVDGIFLRRVVKETEALRSQPESGGHA